MSQMSQDFHSILYFCSLNYTGIEINRTHRTLRTGTHALTRLRRAEAFWQCRSDLARLLDDYRGVRITQNDSRCWFVCVLGDHPPAAARSASEVIHPRRVEQISEVHDVGTLAAALRTRGSCRGHGCSPAVTGFTGDATSTGGVWIAAKLADTGIPASEAA
jgi:hypothetical protein